MFRLLLLLLIVNTALFSQTSLWKVTYEGKTLYIGGTIHILRASDFPLPKAYEEAFSAADTLVFETDIGAMNSPQIMAEGQRQLMCGAGESLHDFIRTGTYMQLKEYADSHRIPMEIFDRMKPQLVVVSVMGVELQRLGWGQSGVDHYYFTQASERGKPITWFESVEEQMKMFEAMGSDDEDKMVRQSLGEIAQYGMVMASMIEAWQTGDIASLEALGKTYLMHESPTDYRRLVVDRNRQWMGKIKQMLQSPQTEMILVGALHLVGPEGLLSLLKREGCRIEQL